MAERHPEVARSDWSSHGYGFFMACCQQALALIDLYSAIWQKITDSLKMHYQPLDAL
jgi:hypothetical protein